MNGAGIKSLSKQAVRWLPICGSSQHHTSESVVRGRCYHVCELTLFMVSLYGCFIIVIVVADVMCILI